MYIPSAEKNQHHGIAFALPRKKANKAIGKKVGKEGVVRKIPTKGDIRTINSPSGPKLNFEVKMSQGIHLKKVLRLTCI